METLKGNLPELPRRTEGLPGLMDAACGLAVAKPYRTEAARIRAGMTV
jgi:hypothetical protein